MRSKATWLHSSGNPVMKLRCWTWKSCDNFSLEENLLQLVPQITKLTNYMLTNYGTFWGLLGIVCLPLWSPKSLVLEQPDIAFIMIPVEFSKVENVCSQDCHSDRTFLWFRVEQLWTFLVRDLNSSQVWSHLFSFVVPCKLFEQLGWE